MLTPMSSVADGAPVRVVLDGVGGDDGGRVRGLERDRADPERRRNLT